MLTSKRGKPQSNKERNKNAKNCHRGRKTLRHEYTVTECGNRFGRSVSAAKGGLTAHHAAALLHLNSSLTQ